MKKIYLLVLLLISGLVSAQSIPIIEVRENDSDGVPVHEGELVTVTGTITTSNQFGTDGPAYIQDPTAGVAIYGGSFASFVEIDDSITITAEVTNYRGLTELDFGADGSQFSRHGDGQKVQPKVVTLAELYDQEWNGTEEFEGSLVRINNVSINGTGNFEGGTNYQITDSTGSLEMRIDDGVGSIIGTAIPSSVVDIIGVVGQFNYGAPYDEGYQILPRFADDILIEDEPIIISPVVASDITTNSVTVYFSTINKGDTKVEYGKTEQLELGTISIDEDTTYHVVKIEDLEPLTTYYYKAFSSNGVITSESDIYSVTTASTDPELGEMNVYFNEEVDNSVAIPGNEVEGDVDLRDKIIDRINTATYSIDMAVYSFTLNDVANALIAAKNRGVKVRVVYHNRDVQSAMQQLLDNGIQMSQRASGGLMHNKFAVFDARDDSTENDWVWTGSWNWTTLEMDWRNNVMEINDPSLAEAYTNEFEEMWGSDGDNPDPDNAKFGSQKTDNTAHFFNIGGKPVKLYFSPSDNTENYIENAVASADTSIYFSLLVFTSNGLYSTIEDRHSSGVEDIRGVINDVNSTGSVYSNLQNLSNSEVFSFGGSNTMHNKYGLVDAPFPTSKPTTITGSHNWSAAANESNDENTLIIDDIYIANQYMQEFKKVYNESGGTTSFVVPVISDVQEEGLYPDKIKLNQNYPNPFNPLTTITFFLPQRKIVDLSVYNMLGEKVVTIYRGEAQAGLNVFDFNVNDVPGGLASGMYIYRLSTGQKSISKKLILLK